MPITSPPTSPLITICIPTYNHEQYIEKAVKSVLDQGIADIYIIIADDASTDRTPEICKALQSQHPKSIALFLHSKNLGLVKNTTFLQSQIPEHSKYLCWFSGDDLFLADKFKKQIAFLDSHPDYVMCYHNVLVFDENKNKQYLYNHWLYGASQHSGDIFKKLITDSCFMAGLSILIRYNKIKHIPHRPEIGIFNDWLYFIEIAACGKTGYLQDTLAVYRRHSTNISHKNLPIETALSVYDYLYANYDCNDVVEKGLISLYLKFAIKSCLQKNHSFPYLIKLFGLSIKSFKNFICLIFSIFKLASRSIIKILM